MFSYKIANHVFDNVLMDENEIYVTFGIKRGVRKEMNFVRLSHDRVTFDVDRHVSTAMLLIFTTALVVHITARITFINVFIRSSNI